MAAVEPAVTEQPEQAALDVGPPTGEGPPPSTIGWSSGLCKCFSDMKSCCLGFFCSPILACKLSGKMGECCCAGCIGPAALRTKHRMKHDIQGSVCNDSLVSCLPCLLPCALCQLARDLKTRSQP
ncbi:placenta-specific gene 8 protein-like [Dendronephthya gigantea]|uniref:placenta-specific gene 8 protein-like n=1 Tax=Dendronephthya gigantea TaxID=151771 RepID=UPI00106B95FC|nr:placenta-specific gene 8 protein-like [Dendronephthya gigantea]